MLAVLNNILKTVKDCVFPIFCLGCDKEGAWICETCRKRLDSAGVFACPNCGRQGVGGRSCKKCQGESCLSSHIAVCGYSEEALSGRLITVFKYSLARDAAGEIEKLLINFFSAERRTLFIKNDLVIPTPLHPRRFAERGFNQAAIIARLAAEILGVEYAEALQRIRPTKQQAILKRAERLANVKGAFKVKPDYEEEVRGKNVLLVDDVFTTGATLQECAKALRESGAAAVSGFSLARG